MYDVNFCSATCTQVVSFSAFWWRRAPSSLSLHYILSREPSVRITYGGRYITRSHTLYGKIKKKNTGIYRMEEEDGKGGVYYVTRRRREEGNNFNA